MKIDKNQLKQQQQQQKMDVCQNNNASTSDQQLLLLPVNLTMDENGGAASTTTTLRMAKRQRDAVDEEHFPVSFFRFAPSTWIPTHLPNRYEVSLKNVRSPPKKQEMFH